MEMLKRWEIKSVMRKDLCELRIVRANNAVGVCAVSMGAARAHRTGLTAAPRTR